MLLLRRNKAVAGLSAYEAAVQLKYAIESGLIESRTLAREAARLRLKAELNSLGISVPVVVAPLAKRLFDVARGRLYASRFAQHWLTVAQASSVKAANAATQARLKALATTEASGAFNEQRREYARLIPHLMRMWDARNDNRTCGVCRAAHGTVVGANESFPQGEPGVVHPNCMCTWHLLTVEEIRR